MRWKLRDMIVSDDPKENCYAYYIEKITRMGQAVYEWSDPEIGRLIERYLWSDGVCIMWDSADLGLVVTRCVEKGYNINGDAVLFEPQFDVVTDSRIAKPTMTTAECVAIYDLPVRDIRRSDCLWLCSQIVDVNDTIRTQVANQKTPMVGYAGSRKLAEKIRNAFVQIAEGAKALILDLDMRDQFQVLDFNAPYNVESLQQYLWSLESEMLEFLGIDSQDAFQKKERLIVDEQEGNDELLNYMLASGLKMRRIACDRINEMFGINLSVDVQGLVRPLQAMEDETSMEDDTDDNSR